MQCVVMTIAWTMLKSKNDNLTNRSDHKCKMATINTEKNVMKNYNLTSIMLNIAMATGTMVSLQFFVRNATEYKFNSNW